MRAGETGRVARAGDPLRAPPEGAAPDVEAPLAYRAVRGGLWVALSSWWMIAAGFAANIALTRILAPEAFGVFALAMFFAQALRLQPRLGLGYAYGQHSRSDAEARATFVTMDLGAAAAGMALTLAAAPVLLALGYEALTVRVAMALGAAATLESLTTTGTTLLEKELRFGPVSLLQGIVFPLSYAPALWLATRGEGVWSLVAQNMTYNALYLLGVLGILAVGRARGAGERRGGWRVSRALAGQFLRFGAGVGIGLLGVMLLAQLDSLLVGSLAGVALLGYYDRAYRTAQWPGTLLNALIARTGFYTFARLQDDGPRLGRALRMMVWALAALALPISLVVFASAPELMALLYGERWLPSAPYLRILALVAGARPLVDNANMLFSAVGKPWLTARLTAIQVGVLAIVGLPLVWRWGAYGACLSVAAATVTGLALVLRRLDRLACAGVSRELLIPALAAVVAAAGALLLDHLPVIASVALPLRAALKAGAVAGLFGLVLVAAQARLVRERVAYVWRLARAGLAA